MTGREKKQRKPSAGVAALFGKLRAWLRVTGERLSGRGGKKGAQDADSADAASAGKRPLHLRLIKGFLTLLLVGVGSGVFYLAMILGQPQGGSEEGVGEQPLLAAAPAVHLTAASQLPQMVSQFPIPVLGFMEGSDAVLIRGSAFDTAFEQGFARIVSLTYQTAAGQEIQVQSIYPARAIALLTRDGFVLGRSPLYTFAGLHGVRMDSPSAIRIHAQNHQGVYTVTYPAAMGDTFLDFGRGLTMFVPAGED